MQYSQLGNSGLKVSPLCLGTMMFGGRTDKSVSANIVASAWDAGINFIDTADVYNAGVSEQITGSLIKASRHDWVLATKVGNAMSGSPMARGLSRKWLMQAVDDSLRRLDTDYIDIYYLHLEDLNTPLQETIGAIGDLIRHGKIRYFGLSNFRAWRVAEIIRLCDKLNVPYPVVSQPYYNALNRMPETEHLPVCEHYGLGVFSYSPLARGVLTGKYLPQQAAPSDTRAGQNDKRIMQTEWREESLIIAQQIKQHATAQGISAGQFALSWVLNNSLISGAIAGPRTMEQWQEYLSALDYQFTKADEALIDQLVITGHSSTPGYNDPAYPLVGRVSRV
ncbi:MAG: aryl-alcohol dehydrogenase-like predicted oxidoreductase [Oceanospirillaceae bacterium]|jgi:aryl-alcohol dehydrogenase-like predicted oxidoreductase